MSELGGGENTVSPSNTFPLGRGREEYVLCLSRGVEEEGSVVGSVRSACPLKRRYESTRPGDPTAMAGAVKGCPLPKERSKKLLPKASDPLAVMTLSGVGCD